MSVKNLNLKKEVMKAIACLEDYTTTANADSDMEIGSDAIKNARGLAFLTSYTVGFFGGGTFSHGILIAKKPGSDKWGLPVAISGGGVNAMFGLGYREDITLYMLDTDEAVESTFGNHSLKVALTSSLALGPVGRTVDGGAYINMDKKGLEVSYFSTRDDDTREFYGINGGGGAASTHSLTRSFVRSFFR